MPKKAGMEKWKKKRRQEYLEMKQYRYYIFCEGQQTEPLYFEGFKKLIEDNLKLVIRYARRIINNSKGKTPTETAPGTRVHELVEELVKYLPENVAQRFKEV